MRLLGKKRSILSISKEIYNGDSELSNMMRNSMPDINKFIEHKIKLDVLMDVRKNF